MNKLAIRNIKAWIVLPEITEIVVAETGYDYSTYIFMEINSYCYKDYYERLSEAYLDQIIRPEVLILYFVSDCKDSSNNYLGLMWTCTNPNENLEKLLLEAEKKASNEQS